MVLNGDHQPVADQEVEVGYYSSADSAGRDGQHPVSLGVARSGADGWYQFSLGSLQNHSVMLLADVRVAARWRGPDSPPVPWKAEASCFHKGALRARIDVRLASPGMFYGRVVDGQGEPVVGADAAVHLPDSHHSPIVTNRAGYYVVSLAGEEPGAELLLGASHPQLGFAKPFKVRWRQGQQAPDLVLLPQGTGLQGEVVFADGTPVDDLALSVSLEEGMPDPPPLPVGGDEDQDPPFSYYLGSEQVRTDAAGRFQLRGFVPSTYRVVPLDGENTVVPADWDDVGKIVRTGGRVRIRLPWQRIRLHVVDQDGRRLEDSALSLWVWSGTNAAKARRVLRPGVTMSEPLRKRAESYASPDVGHHHTVWVARGSYLGVQVQHRRGLPVTRFYDVPVDGYHHELVVRMQAMGAGGNLRVRVQDPRGRSLDNYLWHVRLPTSGQLYRTRYGDKGKLWQRRPVDGLLRSLPPGSLRVHLRCGWSGAQAFAPLVRTVNIAEDQNQELTVKVKRLARLRLRLARPKPSHANQMQTLDYRVWLRGIVNDQKVHGKLHGRNWLGRVGLVHRLHLNETLRDFEFMEPLAVGDHTLHLEVGNGNAKFASVVRTVSLRPGYNDVEVRLKR